MAIDSRDKRFSLIGLDLGFVHVLPNPDGTIDAGDRVQFVTKYRGFADGGAPPAVAAPTPRRLLLMGVGH